MRSHAFVGSRKQLQHNQAFSTVNIKCNYERAIFAGWLLRIAIQGSRFASGLIYRIKRAAFPTEATLESYNWSRNPTTITREPFLELATGEFIRRKENAAFVGESGLGKTHLMQGIARMCSALGYRVAMKAVPV